MASKTTVFVLYVFVVGSFIAFRIPAGITRIICTRPRTFSGKSFREYTAKHPDTPLLQNVFPFLMDFFYSSFLTPLYQAVTAVCQPSHDRVDLLLMPHTIYRKILLL